MPDEARSLALALPEAVELDHHGRPSFRVGGRIFATLWSERQLNVMLDEGGVLTATQAAPDVCREIRWGTRLAAVGVALDRADRERRAPGRLLRTAGPDDVAGGQTTA